MIGKWMIGNQVRNNQRPYIHSPQLQQTTNALTRNGIIVAIDRLVEKRRSDFDDSNRVRGLLLYARTGGSRTNEGRRRCRAVPNGFYDEARVHLRYLMADTGDQDEFRAGV